MTTVGGTQVGGVPPPKNFFSQSCFVCTCHILSRFAKSLQNLKAHWIALLEDRFERYGHCVHDHPWKFILYPTIACLILTMGMVFRVPELDMEVLYALPNSLSTIAKAELNQVFPIERVAYIFAVSDNGNDVLSRQRLKSLDDLWQRIKSLKIPRSLIEAAFIPGDEHVTRDWLLTHRPELFDFSTNIPINVPTNVSNRIVPSSGLQAVSRTSILPSNISADSFITMDDVCLKGIDGLCLTMSPLDLYATPSHWGHPIRSHFYPLYINHKTAKGYVIDAVLGGLELRHFPEATEVVNATAAAFRIDLDGSWDNMKQTSTWEQALISFIQLIELPPFHFYVKAERSVQDALALSCQLRGDDLFLLCSAAVFVFIFAISMSFSKNRYRSKVISSAIGVISTLLAYSGGVGLCHFLGLKHVPPAESTPFILLGIGVDDIFVLTNAYTMTYLHSTDSRTRMGLTLRDAGISISITTITNIIAFGIGATSPYYSITVFCIVTAVALLTGFLLAITVFCGVLALEAVKESRYCSAEKDDAEKDGGMATESQRPHLFQGDKVTTPTTTSSQDGDSMAIEHSAATAGLFEMTLPKRLSQSPNARSRRASESPKASRSRASQSPRASQTTRASQSPKASQSPRVSQIASPSLFRDPSPRAARSPRTSRSPRVSQNSFQSPRASQIPNVVSFVSSTFSILPKCDALVAMSDDGRDGEGATVERSSGLPNLGIAESTDRARRVMQPVMPDSQCVMHDGQSVMHGGEPNPSCESSATSIVSLNDDGCEFRPSKKSSYVGVLDGSNQLVIAERNHRKKNSSCFLKDHRKLTGWLNSPQKWRNVHERDTMKQKIRCHRMSCLYPGGKSHGKSEKKFFTEDVDYWVCVGQRFLPLKEIDFEEPKGNLGRKSRAVFMNYYGPLIMNPIMKMLIVLGFLGLLIFSSFSSRHVDPGLTLRTVTPDGSYLADFLNVRDDYFHSYGDECVVFFPWSSNWWKEDAQEAIQTLHERLNNSDFSVFINSGFPYWLAYMKEHRRNDNLTSVGLTMTEDERKEEFVILLKEWMLTARGAAYGTHYLINEEHQVSWKFYFWMRYVDNSAVSVTWLKEVQRYLADLSPYSEGWIYTPFSVIWESDPVILHATLSNMGIALLSMGLIASLLIPDLRSGLLVLLIIVMIDVSVFGFMPIWDLRLNMLTMVNLILSIGFAVDYTAHFTHCYSHCKGPTRESRVIETLVLMGLPITNGMLSTYAAAAVLVFSSKFTLVVVFRMITLVLSFAFLHGMLLVPVLLSYMGPMPAHEVDVYEVGSAVVVETIDKNTRRILLASGHHVQRRREIHSPFILSTVMR